MKYKQVEQNIIDDIKAGKHAKGMRIPSIRDMAQKHSVNKSTVIKAYEELESRHIIYSIAKSGYYVTGEIAEDNFNDAVINFARLVPDEKLLPFREFNHCVNRAIDIYKRELFTYGDVQGLLSLRNALTDYFYSKDIYARAENICITSGAHQALSILINMDFPNGKKKVLIENPTYSEIYGMFDTFNTEYKSVSRNNNGLDLADVERIFKQGDIKFFYTMPKFHNPLGTNLPVSQKKRLVDLAKYYDVYIVEDDYLGDIEAGKNILPIHYYDTYGRVIYLRSFSKSFMPGIRLGCAVVHSDLKAEFLKVKRCRDLSTSILMQGALELYITNGMYVSHIKRINEIYKNKYDVFLEQLNILDKERIYINPTKNSQLFWMDIRNINSKSFANTLHRHGVKVGDGAQNIAEDCRINGLRLSIMSLSSEDIRQGMNIIYSNLKEHG